MVGSLIVVTTTAAAAQRPATVRLVPGMVITRSVRITPGIYRLAASASPDSALITIRGEGITVDFAGATLQGQDPAVDPDRATGLAILIDGGRAVTLKNARIRGYRTAIRAVGTSDLSLLDNDLSHNWKPRLFSLVGHESLVDWLSFHHNEAGEWRRFGAGIALERVHRGVVRGNTVRQGMNGLLLTRSDSLRIEHNDLSFNSGLGIGLYRSTDNVIVRNRVDYNVRGFSNGFYRRGQDSANLLMFEQSSRNVVAWNSMTHGGDGLFLWAGQQTMDTGEGGSNDNLFLANDFSHAPTNAMEATFSRNSFVANRVMGSDHGLWGGYSYNSRIIANCFARNRVGIAIEHGQDNVIEGNTFTGDSTAIQLWADPVEPSDWGYPKHRDTRSRGWTFEGNDFLHHRVGLRIRQTSDLREGRDVFLDVDTVTVMRDTSNVSLGYRIDRAGPTVPPCRAMPAIPTAWSARAPAVDAREVPTSPVASMDRSAIVVDEWGPYDWSTPKLFPIANAPNGRPRLRILGPLGVWQVRDLRGVIVLSDASGRIGDTLIVTPAPDSVGHWRIELEDERGRRFGYERFEPITGWNARYFTWTDSTSWTGT
ncbi:MAG: NosD domain-containing protein, partial [Gemmatimonadota bacterium]